MEDQIWDDSGQVDVNEDGKWIVGAVAVAAQTARARARARMVDLDKERQARDKRIEAGVVAFYTATDALKAAQDAASAAQEQLAVAVRTISKEGVPADQVAALCELSVTEVRRLSRPATDTLPATGDGTAS